MIIIGVDYHPSFQQIAFLDQETGECGERPLNHSDGEAEKFYRELKPRGVSVRVGKIGFLESGYRVRRIVICGNCSGTGTDWCRCGRDS
jgi:hypothetical protein